MNARMLFLAFSQPNRMDIFVHSWPFLFSNLFDSDEMQVPQ